jgi:hypothetical protein
MSNAPTIPATLRFFQPTWGLTAAGKLARLTVGAEYKVLKVEQTNKYNDYGYLVYTRLVIQRTGGKQVSIPWGTVEAVAC